MAALLSLLLAATAALPARQAGAGTWEVAFPVMGTRALLLLRTDDRASAEQAGAAARAELERIERMMSEWRPESPLSQVNAAAGVRPVRVPPELLEVVARALAIARASGGAFDPTWAGMRGIWRFGDAQDGTVPSREDVEKGRGLVDFRRVHVDHRRATVYLEARGMALGLGGIAKGYAVDRVAELLRARGIGSFVVQVGGDLYAAGRKQGSRPWTSGVQDPRGPGIFASIALEDASFSTSGDYERFFIRDGVRYHHIIDPATGWPARASRSVTARCKDAYTADAVTKPVFILGPERGMAFAAQQGCDVLIVDAENRVHVSPGLEKALRWTRPTPP